MKNKSKCIWFISDLHFDHKNILEYSGRPFKTVPEMNAKLIANIKRKVRPGDVLIIVGDFQLGAKKEALRDYIRQIKETGCTLVLVRGNHDYNNSEMMNCGFDLSVDKLEMEISREWVTIMHYPYRQPVYKYLYYSFMNFLFGKLFPKRWWKERYYWRKLSHRNKYLIHGHTHSTQLQNGFMINVSAEAVNYEPINLQKMGELISKHKMKRQKMGIIQRLFAKKEFYRDHEPKNKKDYK